jgi:hypothetical protein
MPELTRRRDLTSITAMSAWARWRNELALRRFLSGMSSAGARQRRVASFDQARAEFEEARTIFLSNRTEADFEEWRNQCRSAWSHGNSVFLGGG